MIIRNNYFLLDTNSIITPYKTYYPFDFAERFWTQLKEKIESGDVLIMDVVRDELLRGDDELSDWIKEIDTSLIVSRNDSQIIKKYGEILSYIQSSKLYNDRALKVWSESKVADAWLIATAIIKGYKVVTFERENKNMSPKSPTKNPKIPDICNEFGVESLDLYQMMRALNIRF